MGTMTDREQRLVDALERLIFATMRVTEARADEANEAGWLDAVNGKLHALSHAQTVMADIRRTNA